MCIVTNAVDLCISFDRKPALAGVWVTQTDVCQDPAWTVLAGQGIAHLRSQETSKVCVCVMFTSHAHHSALLTAGKKLLWKTDLRQKFNNLQN